MRYAKQNDYNDCGPMALRNACVWAGFDVSEEDYEMLKDVSGWEYETGVLPSEFDVAVKNGPWDSFAFTNFTMDDVDEWLANGGAVIIQYPNEPEKDPTNGHIAFLAEKKGNRYAVVNDGGMRGKDVHFRNRKTLEKYLNDTRREVAHWDSVWWFIARKP